MRWFALTILHLIAVMFLASGSVASQWVGWSLSVVACAFWANFARLDKDTPRMLMELFYLMCIYLGDIQLDIEVLLKDHMGSDLIYC